MNPIKVVVRGAYGRMGREVVNAVCRDAGMQLCGAVEQKVVDDCLPLPGGGSVPIATSLESIIARSQPDVIVDFTIASAVMPAVRIATKQGVNLVIGTTGLTTADLDEINRLAIAGQVGAVVAPNFTVGAVLMIHLAKIAAKYLDNVEILELHHHLKADAPSGTALSTAKAMVQARGKPFDSPPGKQASRGEPVDGVTIHSIRLPGLMAHQEIIFGGLGQTLHIRHDTISRECYMPGVMLAIREVVKRKGLTYGLDALLGLQEIR